MLYLLGLLNLSTYYLSPLGSINLVFKRTFNDQRCNEVRDPEMGG